MAAGLLTKAVAVAHREVTGTEPELVGKRIVGDANLYVHGSGMREYFVPTSTNAQRSGEST